MVTCKGAVAEDSCHASVDQRRAIGVLNGDVQGCRRQCEHTIDPLTVGHGKWRTQRQPVTTAIAARQLSYEHPCSCTRQNPEGAARTDRSPQAVDEARGPTSSD